MKKIIGKVASSILPPEDIARIMKGDRIKDVIPKTYFLTKGLSKLFGPKAPTKPTATFDESLKGLASYTIKSALSSIYYQPLKIDMKTTGAYTSVRADAGYAGIGETDTELLEFFETIYSTYHDISEPSIDERLEKDRLLADVRALEGYSGPSEIIQTILILKSLNLDVDKTQKMARNLSEVPFLKQHIMGVPGLYPIISDPATIPSVLTVINALDRELLINARGDPSLLLHGQGLTTTEGSARIQTLIDAFSGTESTFGKSLIALLKPSVDEVAKEIGSENRDLLLVNSLIKLIRENPDATQQQVEEIKSIHAEVLAKPSGKDRTTTATTGMIDTLMTTEALDRLAEIATKIPPNTVQSLLIAVSIQRRMTPDMTKEEALTLKIQQAAHLALIPQDTYTSLKSTLPFDPPPFVESDLETLGIYAKQLIDPKSASVVAKASFNIEAAIGDKNWKDLSNEIAKLSTQGLSGILGAIGNYVPYLAKGQPAYRAINTLLQANEAIASLGDREKEQLFETLLKERPDFNSLISNVIMPLHQSVDNSKLANIIESLGHQFSETATIIRDYNPDELKTTLQWLANTPQGAYDIATLHELNQTSGQLDAAYNTFDTLLAQAFLNNKTDHTKNEQLFKALETAGVQEAGAIHQKMKDYGDEVNEAIDMAISPPPLTFDEILRYAAKASLQFLIHSPKLSKGRLASIPLLSATVITILAVGLSPAGVVLAGISVAAFALAFLTFCYVAGQNLKVALDGSKARNAYIKYTEACNPQNASDKVIAMKALLDATHTQEETKAPAIYTEEESATYDRYKKSAIDTAPKLNIKYSAQSLVATVFGLVIDKVSSKRMNTRELLDKLNEVKPTPSTNLEGTASSISRTPRKQDPTKKGGVQRQPSR
ncbi:hypothetical protein MMH89_00065 [Candidatus Comchoanobacter bicostacola]|uniref:Uncharacterized protein n=1 Tax=Candidatus Comchoanobacter bicostacola TaxID=2919598 RepID=A0ABY5DL99_9GAMM|nr:hypothetical protein [Candidatus Comchoanobacter bicostacola]UTC24562.1 hypothetical protein MMH89_00065 [Candidatus Comchoanobacter bicostacola]